VKRDFLLMWLFIIGVSVHDGLLVLSHRIVMSDSELNPIGRWLIHSNGGDIWLLLAVKTLGTLAASSILLWLYWLRPRLGWTVCAGVCLLQLTLLIFLYLPLGLAHPVEILDLRLPADSPHFGGGTYNGIS
jgi:hypothetical protein